MTTTVAVARERVNGERRVALVPETVHGLVAAGFDVVVETGAGRAAGFDDAEYVTAGASIAEGPPVEQAQIVVCVRPPDDLVDHLRRGQIVLGLLDPAEHQDTMTALAGRGVTALAFESVPRTVSRAQAMDALSSQANAAGYRAAILAAERFGGYFPMMTTAAGTCRPAQVLVIGAGVAGLQALATARRLGAVTTGYDIRASSRDEVRSVGATFVTSGITKGSGAGGYARALSEGEQQAQRTELGERVARSDVVITTAKSPGGRPPLLVTSEMLERMPRGAVCVDLACGPDGGNVEGAVDGGRFETANGVLVIGAAEAAADLPTAASTLYSHNVAAVLRTLTHDGAGPVDLSDEVVAAMAVVRNGRVMRTPRRAPRASRVASPSEPAVQGVSR